MKEYYNNYYIALDGRGCITDGWSDGPHPERSPSEGICINNRGDYQFKLFPDGEENPFLFNEQGIPLYRWDGKEIILRTEEEIAADLAALPEPEPTLEEKNESKLDFLMVLNGMVSPPAITFAARANPEPTIEDYIKKYYPKLWGPPHLMKLVEAGIISEEVYERLVEE